MARNIYVGNLSYEVTDEILRKHFEEIGECASATVIMDKFTGQSKGFGFVEMAHDKDAQEAIKKLNGEDFYGRKLTVNEAKPKRERESGFRGRERF